MLALAEGPPAWVEQPLRAPRVLPQEPLASQEPLALDGLLGAQLTSPSVEPRLFQPPLLPEPERVRRRVAVEAV